MRASSRVAVTAALVAGVAHGADVGPAPEYNLDVRASTYAQLFRRNLAPGTNGAVLETEQLATFYGYAFLRLQNVDLPWGKDALSAELSVWGALGLLPNSGAPNADGDIVSAWVQDVQGPVRVKVGRQVTLPGAARYVRFDGAELGLQLGGFDLSAYGGWVALPRFNRPRGYYVLGSMADAVRDPTLLEVQSRAGQWLVGGRVAWTGTRWLRASVAFHEQRGQVTGVDLQADGSQNALAFRNLAADILFTRVRNLTLGGRFVFDLSAMAPAEARAYADLTFLPRLPISIDYSYQAPALLLPASSIFAAFGSDSWHEAGAEATWRLTPAVRLVIRAAGQLYGSGLGFRGTLRALATPDPVSQRLTLIGEYTRVGAEFNGYHHLRAAARLRFAEAFAVSADGGLYVYDAPVRNTRLSAMAFASIEHAVLPQLRFMLTGSLASTPFATLDAQLLGRMVFELDGPSAGGGL